VVELFGDLAARTQEFAVDVVAQTNLAIKAATPRKMAKLRAELEGTGVEFASDTDTECVAHLLVAELALVDGEIADPARLVFVGERWRTLILVPPGRAGN
jgi:hypothetical protein